MTKPEHIKTPWKLIENGRAILGRDGTTVENDDGICLSEVDRAFVVRAVNAHEKLVHALSYTVQWLPPGAAMLRSIALDVLRLARGES